MDPERDAIISAMDRLLAGKATRSSGSLTVVSLAAEAQVKRHVLTHRHLDLKQLFYDRVRSQAGMLPTEIALREEIATLKKRLADSRNETNATREKLEQYARVIRLITVELKALRSEKLAGVSVLDERRTARHTQPDRDHPS